MKKLIYLSLLLVCFNLAGCTSVSYRQASHNITATQQHINTLQHQGNNKDNVKIKKGYYVDTTPASLKQTPSWMEQNIHLRANQMPMRLLVKSVLNNTSMLASYDDTVSPNHLVSLRYRGTISGALKSISEKTGYAYTVNGNQIEWSALQTHTFDISFMPGTLNYSVGNEASTKSTTTDNDDQGIADDQTNRLTGNLSIWDDLEKTLNQLKSKDGKVVVSEATTSVTIQDHPENVQAIATYIRHLNRVLSKEVAIKVEVLEIQLTKQFNFGVDWNVVAHVLNTDFQLENASASATEIATTANTGSTSGVTSFALGNIGGTQSLIKALNQQGAIRIVTQPQVVTLNNQVATIRITQNTSYLKSVTSSITDNSVSTSLDAGSVSEGFILYILPKIERQQVYMAISSSISSLLRLDKESNAPNNASVDKGDYSAIQTPILADKQFTQRSVVKSGETLVIAGFQRLKDETEKSAPFNIKPLAGHGSLSEHVQTLMLITPVILNKKN